VQISHHGSGKVIVADYTDWGADLVITKFHGSVDLTNVAFTRKTAENNNGIRFEGCMINSSIKGTTIDGSSSTAVEISESKNISINGLVISGPIKGDGIAVSSSS
jgi:hypothetical protein